MGAVPAEPVNRGDGAAPAAPPAADEGRSSWRFEEGASIAPGRTIVRPLGGGSRFEVFLVWDDRRFALMVAKVLRPHVAEDGRALQDLAAEAEALRELAHPVLVRSFDAVLDGQYPHLLIEHLEGPTLRSLIRRGGPLAIEQLLPLALHVASALHYLAGEGWVHLDVKPDNIVMGVPPRLIDLSVARRVERAARLRGVVGTDAYMAPEQCAPGSAVIGPAADVFGLGATLFHAVAGTRPFPREKGDRDSDDPLVRFPQLRTGPVNLPPRTPAVFAELLHAMLDRDAAARPTAAECAIALEPLVDALPRKMVLGKRGARAVT